MRIFLPVVVSLFLVTRPSVAGEEKSCWDTARTQYDLDFCANDGLRKVDAELNAFYQRILKEYAADPKFIEKFKGSRRAWLKFRDAEMAALLSPHDEDPMAYGSVQPMCESHWLAVLTRERIEQLKKWADRTNEGDVCSGSIKMKEQSK